MTNDLTPSEPQTPFEKIRKTGEQGHDYWTARELAEILGYLDYRNFDVVLQKAKQACFNSGQKPENHFGEFNEMVVIGSGAQRERKNTKLSRYACYLIIQNADPAKEIVAQGQSYFAIQTRRAELADSATEKTRRIELRKELSVHNERLAGVAKRAGVVQPMDYAIFTNHGYMGLYGGLTAQDIHRKKGLKKSQKILDHMGSTELAANLFRATQAEEKIRRENIVGKENANRAHNEVGTKVRKAIADIGGTMPEHLPVVEDVKKLEKKAVKKRQIGNDVQ
jgi:DNA-damage-inducible protein D